MRQFSSSDVWKGRSSELDWPINSPAIRTLERPPRRSTWYCGDRQKLKQVVSNFAQNSSMHGVSIVCSKDNKMNWWLLLFYRLLFGLSVASVVLGVTFLVQQSFTAESVFVSSTNKEFNTGTEEDPYFPEFPRIVVCRRPGYGANSRDPKLLDYALLALGSMFPSLTPMERSLMITSRLYSIKNITMPEPMEKFFKNLNYQKGRYASLKNGSENFSLKEFVTNNSVSCKDIFIHCVAFLFFFDCCSAFHLTLTSQGVCYSMELTGQALLQYRKSKDLGFSFFFDLQSVTYFDKAVDVGYDVHLLDPRDPEIAVYSKGHPVVNGYATFVKTKLIKTSRVALYTPWHGLSDKCPTLPAELDVMGLGDRFFRNSCGKHFMDRMVEKLCGCRCITDKSSVSLRECDPEDMYACFVDRSLRDNLTQLKETCKHPCIEYEFKSEVNMVKLGAENVSRLVLVFDGVQYVLHEYRTTTMSGFLSQIGGALGLYVGASIITAVELFAFLLTWCWYRFLPHRRKVHDRHPLRRRTKEKDPYSYYY